MADTVAVTVVNQVGDDVLARVKEMVDSLKVEKQSLHVDLVAEWVAQAWALDDNIRLQLDRKKTSDLVSERVVEARVDQS